MVGSYWLPIGNPILRIQWSRDGWRHVTPKLQGRDPDIFEAQYLKNRARYTVGSNRAPIRNPILRIQWSRDRWRHVTPKGQGRDPDIFDAQYLNNRASYMVGKYFTTNTKPYIENPMVTWRMTSGTGVPQKKLRANM